jgi:hypothetical protein
VDNRGQRRLGSGLAHSNACGMQHFCAVDQACYRDVFVHSGRLIKMPSRFDVEVPLAHIFMLMKREYLGQRSISSNLEPSA